jgi:uncharacterized membrane protein
MTSPAATDESLTQRHWIALTALISGIVALYLHLWKLGLMGTLACTASHGCEIAQFSPYGWFLGVDVAMIGTVGYSLILVTALIGTQQRFRNDRRITYVLMGLIYPAIVFTARLKYAEFIILKTFCPWCAISAVTITTHGFLAWFDLKRVKRAGTPGANR